MSDFGTRFDEAAGLLNEERFEEALQSWQEVNRDFPGRISSIVNECWTLHRLGRGSDALPMLLKVLSDYPRHDIARQLLEQSTPWLTAYVERVPSDLRTMYRMKDAGFEPTSILDVGASQGSWTRFAMQAFGEARFHMVEPLEENAEALEELIKQSGANIRYSKALFSDESGEVDFYVSEGVDKTGSSLFPENTNIEQKPRKLEALTLDEFAYGDDYDFIKIDAQGAELAILKGGERCVAGAEFLLLETSFLPYNKDAPLFAELVAYLDEVGFQCVDVAEIMRHTGNFPAQANLLFAKKGSSYVSGKFVIPQ